MAGTISLLNINPSQLEFLFEADRELKSALNIRNVHDDIRTAFKIKTTNSDRFVVCPPCGIVEPGTTRMVRVYFKAHKEFNDDLRLCKDRFLVQSIVVDPTLNELDIKSDMFKTRQRQEAKLKVIVAAPLAHGNVLEAEIKSIAQRQGIEGHRAVVRKFSELLLARGIISQAQVALAFGTVGEVFQGMQDPQKENQSDKEKSFHNFLQGKSGLNTGPYNGGAGSRGLAPRPSLHRYETGRGDGFNSRLHTSVGDASNSQLYTSLGPDSRLMTAMGRFDGAEGLNPPGSPFVYADQSALSSLRDATSYQEPRGTTGESIINALSLGAELTGPPRQTSRRSLQTVHSEPGWGWGSRPREDDKAEVLPGLPEEPSQPRSKPHPSRRLTYDEAVDQAFPEDMYSEELASGMPGSNAKEGPKTAAAVELTPAKQQEMPVPESQPSPLPNGHSTAKASVSSEDTQEAAKESTTSTPAISPDTPEPRDSAAAPSSPPSQPPAAATEATPATPQEAATAAAEAPAAKPNGVAKEEATRSGSGGWGEPRIKSFRSPRTPKSSLPEKSGEEAFRESLPKLRSIKREVREPAPKEVPEPEKSLPGKVNRASPGDTLGRVNIVTSIDRLATPASRKPSAAAVAALRRDSSSFTRQREALLTGDKGHVNEPPDFSALNVDVRDIDAERREAEQKTIDAGAAISPREDVAIPSGNTQKMASFWRLASG